VDYFTLETLRTGHPAWRLLKADNSALAASFLDRVFLKPNVRQMPESELARQLDDDLYRLRQQLGEGSFPREAKAYLDDWASDRNGWLRKRYVSGSDEAQFDITPATESALTWIKSLGRRSFISTESRLRTIFDLLRDLITDTEPDGAVRIAELKRRRAALDAEIARLDAGDVPLLDDAVVRDRFHLIVETAQSLLSDFRALEQGFRDLDRDVRIKIASWDGRKGELLERILGARDAIAESDRFKEQAGPPARFFVVAEQALSIEASFTGFGRDINTLRKRLRAMPAVAVHDNYPSYGAVFRRRFGIASEQAIDLFLQTVSMKTVGDLTGFVRRHMLEAFPVEERIEQMIRHFDDLTRAHGEVVKARQQIELLNPIVADCDRHAEVAREQEQLTSARDALKAYMASLLIGLIDERCQTVDGEIERVGQRIANLKSKEAENDEVRAAIERDINANGGTRLGQIELELRQKANVRDERQRRSRDYAELTKALALGMPRTPETFADRLTEAKRQLATLTDEEATLQSQRSDVEYDLRIKREAHRDLTAEKPTAETCGSITWIFCSGVAMRSCSPIFLNSVRPNSAASSEPRPNASSIITKWNARERSAPFSSPN
jgi:hypothetical protein